MGLGPAEGKLRGPMGWGCPGRDGHGSVDFAQFVRRFQGEASGWGGAPTGGMNGRAEWFPMGINDYWVRTRVDGGGWCVHCGKLPCEGEGAEAKIWVLKLNERTQGQTRFIDLTAAGDSSKPLKYPTSEEREQLRAVVKSSSAATSFGDPDHSSHTPTPKKRKHDDSDGDYSDSADETLKAEACSSSGAAPSGTSGVALQAGQAVYVGESQPLCVKDAQLPYDDTEFVQMATTLPFSEPFVYVEESQAFYVEDSQFPMPYDGEKGTAPTSSPAH